MSLCPIVLSSGSTWSFQKTPSAFIFYFSRQKEKTNCWIQTTCTKITISYIYNIKVKHPTTSVHVVSEVWAETNRDKPGRKLQLSAVAQSQVINHTGRRRGWEKQHGGGKHPERGVKENQRRGSTRPVNTESLPVLRAAHACAVHCVLGRVHCCRQVRIRGAYA